MCFDKSRFFTRRIQSGRSGMDTLPEAAVTLWKSGDGRIDPRLCRVADGVRARSHRLKALGNAVVPQIPEIIGKAVISHASRNA
jgi:site-specific DNA-cytosine methylase